MVVICVWSTWLPQISVQIMIYKLMTTCALNALRLSIVVNAVFKYLKTNSSITVMMLLVHVCSVYKVIIIQFKIGKQQLGSKYTIRRHMGLELLQLISQFLQIPVR